MPRLNWKPQRVTTVSLGMAAVLGLSLVSPAGAVTVQSLMPASGAVSGWKMVSRPRTYDGNTLYQLVDGEADADKQYSLVNMVDARFAPQGRGNQSIDVNVYDMGDPLNAFGLFSQDRQGGTPVAVGAGGTRTTDGTGMSFWKGRYLIRLASTSRSPAFLKGMDAFARNIAARIPGSSALPPLLKLLPSGAQPNSEKYVRQNVEARAFVSNAVTARYPKLGFTAELFIAQYPSPAGAAAALAKYRTVESRNKGLTSLKGVGNGGFSVLDMFQKNVVVAQKGRYLMGVVKANNMAGAQALVRQAVARVR